MSQPSPVRSIVFTLAGFYRVPWRALSGAALVALLWLDEGVWGIGAAVERLAWARGRSLPMGLRALGAQVGEAVDLRAPLHIHNPQNRLRQLSIGPRTHIGKDCLLDLTAPIHIGASVTLAMRVTLITHVDTYYSPLREGGLPSTSGAVVVEDGAYIGAGATVLHGVRIGCCAVVGAGALVREDVPPYTVVAGVPARIIRRLGSDGSSNGENTQA